MSNQPTDHDEIERAEYFRKIERHFGVRRGGPLLLSPRDWQVVERWLDRGIPLGVVLRGINRAFDRFDATGSSTGKVNSLSYCKQHVEAVWEEKCHPGIIMATESSGNEDPAVEHLEATATACRSAIEAAPELTESLERAAVPLERLAAEAGALGAAELDLRANAVEASFHEATQRQTNARTLRLPRFSPWAV